MPICQQGTWHVLNSIQATLWTPKPSAVAQFIERRLLTLQ